MYCLTNTLNRKIYIGITKNTPEIRFYQHCGWALNYGASMPLANAIRKYGKEAWEIDTLKRCRSKASAITNEINYIKKLNSYCGKEGHNGYNATLGGEGGSGVIRKDTMSKTWRTAKSEMLKALMISHSSFSSEARSIRASKQVGDKNPTYGKKCYHKNGVGKFFVEGQQTKGWKLGSPENRSGKANSFYGKSHSDETKNKIRLAKIGTHVGGNNPAAKAVKIGARKFMTKKAACAALRISYKVLTERLGSKEFSNYSYI